MTICKKCNTNPRRAPGASCLACHNEYQKAYYKKHPQSISKSSAQRRQKIRDLILTAKTNPCTDCGIIYPYFVMDFDHVRGEKKFNLSVAANKLRSIKLILEEIDKCELVCSNCHRIRTMKRSETASIGKEKDNHGIH